MRRGWAGRFGFGMLLASALAGCAAEGMPSSSMVGADPYPPPGLPHRVASSHVELYWSCAPAPGQVQIEGVARNPWSSQPVRFLVLELSGVDGDGRAVSQARAEAPSYLLGTNQVTRFQLALETTGREVRYDLFYQYRFDEPEEKSVRVAGPPMRPRLAQFSFRFMVRDACSDTLHLAQ